MKFPKPKRPKDKKLLDYIKTLGCVVCGLWPSDPDHILSKGAGGGDVPSNLWPLCRRHHTERHAIGFKTFVSKYPKAEAYLVQLKRLNKT